MKPLDPKTIENMKYILKGIKDGKYRHDQSEFHCRSTHCYLGWKLVLDYAKHKRIGQGLAAKVNADVLEKWAEKHTTLPNPFSCADTFLYCQEKWDLNESEAGLLSGAYSLQELEEIIIKFDEGYRLIADRWVKPVIAEIPVLL